MVRIRARLQAGRKEGDGKRNGMAESHALTNPAERNYRSSSITRSSTSGPGRTAEGGRVAKGWSVMFNISKNGGDFLFTYSTPVKSSPSFLASFSRVMARILSVGS